MFDNCILKNVRILEKQLSHIAKMEFESIGIHPTYGYVMTIIAEKEYVKTKEIAEKLSLESSTVTRMIAKLEKDGYVQKGSLNSPVDISLTEKGDEIQLKVEKAWNQFHKKCDEILLKENRIKLNQKILEVNKKF